MNKKREERKRKKRMVEINRFPKLKRYQKKFDFSYAFGAYPVLDLLNFRRDNVIEILYKREGLQSDGVGEILELCRKYGIHCEENDGAIDRIAYKENTYVVGVFRKYFVDLENGSNHIVLVNPSNTGNLGTIIRSMCGFHFKDLAIIKPGADIFDPMTVRSTMGALFRINFHYFGSIEEYVDLYKGNTIYPFMLKGSRSIVDIGFREPFSFVFGNEGKGLDSRYSSLGESVYIPHSEDIDSLNLSVAGSIAMWEFSRRKSTEMV